VCVHYQKISDKTCHVIIILVANSIRDEYTSLHTFDKEAREHYKVNPGTMVVFNAERFYSKHEPKWYTMEIEVSVFTVCASLCV